MLQTHQIEELICLVSGLDRASLVHQFRSFHASFPIDFTREFLETQPVERLRHLFVALCLEQQKMPEFCAQEAA